MVQILADVPVFELTLFVALGGAAMAAALIALLFAISRPAHRGHRH